MFLQPGLFYFLAAELRISGIVCSAELKFRRDFLNRQSAFVILKKDIDWWPRSLKQRNSAHLAGSDFDQRAICPIHSAGVL